MADTAAGVTATRREFLRAGSAATLGLTLPGLMHAAGGPPADSVVFVYLAGGLSQPDSLDPAADSPFRGVPTAVSGVRVCEHLPRLASRLDQCTLIRTLRHGSGHHETAANWLLSGRPGSAFGDHPSLSALASYRAGLEPVVLPRHPAFTWRVGKAAHLGDRHEAREVAGGGLVDSCERAAELAASGRRFVTVVSEGWDHHDDIAGRMPPRLAELDRAVAVLIDALGRPASAARTLVVVASEFGRSPVLNRAGGRAHRPDAGCVLLAGAGVRGGAVVDDRPVSPATLGRAVLGSVGA